MKFARDVDQVIVKHLDQLRKPGVLTVRPGYEATGGWLTKKPAIVVTVDKKTDTVSAQDRLPETLGGFPVDVRQASALQKLRSSNTALFANVAAAAHPEYARPTFDFERDMTGTDLSAAAAAVAAKKAPKKPQLPYAGPAGVTLAPIVDDFTILCHASPDAGWSVLNEFFQKTQSRLTVGMYDLTSAHVLEALETSLAGKTLNLVLDHPAPNPTRDQTDDETYNELDDKLGQDLHFAWALERMDPHAASWIFPNAYHIKVAVRDGTAFWLSSGNWNNSNQPDIDPLTDPQGSAAIARKSDRDWHVVVENVVLAEVFEKYLLNDLEVATKNQATSAALASDRAVIGELAAEEIELTARTPKRYFPPKSITAHMTIRPLLTPDVGGYQVPILKLIQSAKDTLYMQTQYIHASDDETLDALIQAIVKKIDEGLDVRLIFSQWETLDYLEKLQDAGIDLAHVRIQTGVHNKGIIVDGKTVVVSSQNWSGDGVSRNRDAGLIIENADAAQYWQEIFKHDWTQMAIQHAAD